MHLTIDFETRSPVDLKSAGPWKYAKHSGTDALCLAVKADDQPTWIWLPGWLTAAGVVPQGIALLTDDDLAALTDDAQTIHAHNAEFERAIWRHVMARYGFADIPLEKWDCTAARAAMHALPRKLEEAARAVHAPAQKDLEGHRLMLKMCKPRAPRKAEREANPEWRATTYWHEDPQDFIRLFAYCVQDVEAERALGKALRELPPTEKALWRIDQKINERGITIDRESVTAIIGTLARHERSLLDEMATLTGGTVESPRQTAKLAAWLAAQGVVVEDVRKNTVAELLTGVLPANVRRVLEIRQSLAKASTAKFSAMLDRAEDDDRARALYLYHAASTGRFGGKAIQPQNMPRDSYDGAELEEAYRAFIDGDLSYIDIFLDDPFLAASRCIRGALVAANGCRLLCADYSSIEARGNAWLAGESKVLDAFRSGLDLYKVAASGTFGVPYDSVTKDQRQLGKCQILALGYQGGIGAFAAMAQTYGIDLETLPPLVMPYATPEETDGAFGARVLAATYFKKNPDAMSLDAAIACDILKRKWRADNPNIAASWKALEDAAVSAVLEPGAEFMAAKCTYRTWVDPLRNTYLLCRLPSGRVLFYFDPQIRAVTTPWDEQKEVITYRTVDAVTKQWVRRPAYGGLLCENNTQAICRDFMALAMIRCEKAGYPVVLHTHDEIVAEREIGAGSFDEFVGLLVEVPPWAAGMPIAADGWEGKRYRK